MLLNSDYVFSFYSDILVTHSTDIAMQHNRAQGSMLNPHIMFSRMLC